MEKVEKIVINKNRGWRGLAEAVLYSKEEPQLKNVFSFSSQMWYDLINYHIVVMEDDTNYYVVHFECMTDLPDPRQQRSVLITDFIGSIEKVNTYEKIRYAAAEGDDYIGIIHFMKNRNNHTTSDWNCIGLRVFPEI